MSDQKNNSKDIQTSSSNIPSPDSSAKKAEAGSPSNSKTPKNTLAILSLVLVAIASGFFLFRIETLAVQNGALEKHLALITQQSSEQANQSGQLSEQLAQSKAQLDSMNGKLAFMQQTLNQIPGARLEDWKLAEVEYLLRLANQRVTLQKEISGASALFDAADKVLVTLDDPAMIVVREKIAEEMLLLGQASRVDQQGIYTKLQALKNIIHDTIQPPKTFTPQPDTTIQNVEQAAPLSIVDQLLSLISVRTRDKAFDAPLATEQYQLLEHSLTLMLEQAQWAALKGDQNLYNASLKNASNWIENTLRHEQANVMLDQINGLKTLAISAPVPDVSGSLRVLRQIIKDRTFAPSIKQKSITPETNTEQPTSNTSANNQEQA